MSWAVVCTVKSYRFFVTTFIRHYLALGADEIFLYFDDPSRAGYSKIAARGRVKSKKCNDQYWSAKGQKPQYIEERQIDNYRDAANKTKSDWLLHVDIDEFIYARRPVSDVLDDFPENTFSVLVKPLEAIWEDLPSGANVFTTPWFKNSHSPNSEPSALGIFGEKLAKISRCGYWGHTIGKSFVSMKFDINVFDIHNCTPSDEALIQNAESGFFDLLHFEACRYSDWKYRAISRVNGTSTASRMSLKRRRQMELINRTVLTKGNRGLLKLYKKMNLISRVDLDKSLHSGFIVERRPKLTTPKYWRYVP